MRWFTPFALVALVAMGAVRPAQATGPAERTSMSAPRERARATATLREATHASKLAPRRGLAPRTVIGERRSHGDEVFVVPRVVTLLALPTLAYLAPLAVAVPRSAPAPVAEVARGPPSVVVLSRSPH